MDLVASLVMFGGHTAICVWLFNRLHAMPWPCRTIRWLERGILLWAAIVPLLYAARYFLAGASPIAISPATVPWLVYPLACLAAAVAAVPLWLLPKLRERVPAALTSNHTTRLDVAQKLGRLPAGTRLTAALGAIPGNQIFQIHVQTKSLCLPSLPAALDGLTIAHLSDLHMSGRFARPFYEEVVEAANALKPDLIAVTGDICEKEECLEWIVPVLGRLRARHGKFFILGNHETRLTSAEPLRTCLAQAGLVDVAGRWLLHSLPNTEVLLCGSELPWFGSAPDLAGAPVDAFRILLSHSPDQLPWARRQGIGLMLAGHNHGGQIRLPLVGPLIAPSLYGVRYAGGLYHEPPTLLHVTRGIAGLHPVRFNCPPELALLVLKAAKT